MITERERILAHLLNETMTEGDNAYNNFDAAIDLCRKVRAGWQEEEIEYKWREMGDTPYVFDMCDFIEALERLEARL